jgi:hypothetical protein
MLEALRSDTSFLPALSRLLLRSSDVRVRKGHWMTDRLLSLPLETFSPERGVRKLDDLWLEDHLDCPILPECFRSLGSCADTVSLCRA